jgi:hypothetical protein
LAAPGDCRAERQGDRLTITLPGGEGGIRLLREVEGDFTVEVRLWADLIRPGDWAPRGAGILLLAGQDVVKLQRESPVTFPGHERYERLTAGVVHAGVVSGGVDAETPLGDAVSLRLERRGQTLLFRVRPDGSKAWETLLREPLRMPAKVKVGVFVESYARGAFQAEFDRFELAPVSPEPEGAAE